LTTPAAPAPDPVAARAPARLLLGIGLLGLILAALALVGARGLWRGPLLGLGLQGLVSAAALLSMRPAVGGPRGLLPAIDRRALQLWLAAAFAVAGALWGLVYILPARDLGPWAWAGLLGGAALSGAAWVSVVRFFGAVPSPGGRAAAAWARAAALQALLALLGLGAGAAALRWPALGRAEVGLSLVQLGLVLPGAAEAALRTSPALWRWWRLRGPAGGTPAAAQVVLVLVPFAQNNPVDAIFGALQRGLGLDLRGSWALTVLRRALQPLALVGVVVGWLSSGLLMLRPDEQAIVERFGRARPGPPLEPGLHLLAPWPIDQARRAAVRRVASIGVGHGLIEGEPAEAEPEGPESRLWARQHGAAEFTLLLGDGRDLVSLDGRLHYQIVDLRAWLYGTQNPEDTLRALAYEAVTRRTVDQTLDGVLSASVRDLADDVRAAVQRAADQRGLGVQVVEFTFTALHPPVAVAVEYQSVVSAQIDEQTRIVRAQAAAALSVPAARSAALQARSLAQADAARRVSAAQASAAAFLGLRAAARGDEELYRLRRRLEAQELHLKDKPLVILDHRIEQQGGELWLRP
jgi:regulator of protease activity HflC (stomatin/prohibitin superfamily)